ncbi:MAG: hypothetical protein ABL962_01645 [Fimbriimonadaceae bacterium]
MLELDLVVAKTTPPRINLLTAELQPVIVALCRVRSKLWQVVAIDAQTGAVELGLWVSAHAFPHNSVLSPSGRWLSFATMLGYVVGEPPLMSPHYLYDGPTGWEPLKFAGESLVYGRYEEFMRSSDGSPSPWHQSELGSALATLVEPFARLRRKEANRPFSLLRETQFHPTSGYGVRFWTEPDLGLFDDKVHSAIVLTTGELVIARLGVVTCFDIAEDLTTSERWRADLTLLSEDYDPLRPGSENTA